MNKDSVIYVAGHTGLVGSAIVRKLKADGFTNINTIRRPSLDLIEQEQVDKYFSWTKPEYVFLCAAKVGGIHANRTYPADFIYSNLQIQTNVIHSAWKHGAKKLIFLGSSCIYPNNQSGPITEGLLLQYGLEPTNEAYAIAKIAGIKMCQAYRRQHGFDAIALMPTNLYGPGDHYDAQNSHVLPALIRKFHEAKLADLPFVTCWGTGHPRREFLHVDDCADATVYLAQNYSSEDIINVGCGYDLTIFALANLVARIIGYKGEIKWDHSMPDGTRRKLLDISRLTALKWSPKINLSTGIADTYQDFLKNHA